MNFSEALGWIANLTVNTRLTANIDSIMGVMVYSKASKGVFLYIRMLQNRLLVGELDLCYNGTNVQISEGGFRWRVVTTVPGR